MIKRNGGGSHIPPGQATAAEDIEGLRFLPVEPAMESLGTGTEGV